MKTIFEVINNIMISNGLIVAFFIVGMMIWFANIISKYVTKGKVHSAAIAIFMGLVIAYIGGIITKGNKGIADILIFAGMGELGSSMLVDFTIVSTAYGITTSEIKGCSLVGAFSLLAGIVTAFFIGLITAILFGYSDVKVVTTIASGAVTFIVGSVTGLSLGVDSAVIAISIAAGLVKAIIVMVVTPFIAKRIGLSTPKSAIIYGGLMGTTSGVAAGLAATDSKLVPYGAMVATFYTGLGCLLCPTLLYWMANFIFKLFNIG